jgi:hypothetical protein
MARPKAVYKISGNKEHPCELEMHQIYISHGKSIRRNIMHISIRHEIDVFLLTELRSLSVHDNIIISSEGTRKAAMYVRR